MRLVIVDDHRAVAEAFALAFRVEHEVKAVLGEPTQLLAFLGQNDVEILLLDATLPRCNVYDLVRRIRARYRDLTIVAISAFPDQSEWPALRRMGANGVVSKASPLRNFVRSVIELASGRSTQMQRAPPRPHLSPRQLDYLIAVSRGHSHKEIAAELGIHTNWVDELSHEVHKRLGARSGPHMILRAIEEGLIEPRVPPRLPNPKARVNSPPRPDIPVSNTSRSKG